jgi:hypothetical protein
MREPTSDAPATGATALVVPSAPGPIALCSIPAKFEGDAEVVVEDDCVEGGAGGVNAPCSSVMRARTDSILTQ